MSAPSPKTENVIEGSAGPITPVFNDDGVMDTAVRHSNAPINIASPHRFQGGTGLEQPNPDVLVPEGPTEEDILDEEILQQQQAEVGPLNIGEYLPETLLEREQSARGSKHAVGTLSFTDSFIGTMLSKDHMTTAERDQLEYEVANYTEDNPWTAMGTGMVYRAVGDSPIDLAINLATGGLGAAATAVSMTAKFGSSARKVSMAIRNLREASKKGTMTQKTAINGVRDAMEGFAGGALSEFARAEMGRGASLESAIEIGLQDGAVSTIFGYGMRRVGDAAKKAFVKNVTDDVMEELAPDGEIIRNINVNLGLKEALPPAPIVDPASASRARIVGGSADVDFTARATGGADESIGSIVERVDKRDALAKERDVHLEEQAEIMRQQLEGESVGAILDPDVTHRSRLVDGTGDAELDGSLTGGSLKEFNAKVEVLNTNATKAGARRFRQEAKQLEKADVEDVAAKIEELDTDLMPPVIAERFDSMSAKAEMIVAAKIIVGDIPNAKTKRQAKNALKAQEDELRAEAKQLQADIRSLEKELEAAEPRVEKIDVEKTREIVEQKITKKLDEQSTAPISNQREHAASLANNKVDAEVTKVTTLKGLVDVFKKFLHADDKHLAAAVANIVSLRAKAAKMSLSDYLKVKKLSFLDSKGKASTLFTDAATILRAGADRTSLYDMVHELGHIMRSDLLSLKNGKKLIADLEARYGVKDGVWTRAQEERWADEFVRALARLSQSPNPKWAGPTLGLPPSITKAFKGMADWLWTTYEKLIRRGTANEVLRAVEALYDSKQGNRIQAADEAAVLAGRQQAGTTTLHAPDGDLLGAARDAGGAPEATDPSRFQYEDLPRHGGADRTGQSVDELKQFARSNAQSDITETAAETTKRAKQDVKSSKQDLLTAEKQQDLIDTYSDAIGDDPTLNIAGSTLAPRTGLAKKIIDLMNKSQWLSWDNFDLIPLGNMLGGAFSKVSWKGAEAANLSGELLSTMRKTYDDGMAKVSVAVRRGMSKKSDHDLEVVTRNDDNSISKGRQSVELSGSDRVKLTATAMDGLDELGEEYTKHSGAMNLEYLPTVEDTQKGLGGGFVTSKGEIIVLSREQRQLIAEGSLLSKPEQQIVTALQDAYRSIAGRANEISGNLIGRDVFSVMNHYFSPKKTVKVNEELLEKDTLFDRMFDPTSGSERGAVMERKGFATLELSNPFDEVELYMQRTSHDLGHIEYNMHLENLLTGRSRIQLESKIGKGLVRTMDDLLKVSKGDRANLGKSKQGFISKLFTLRQLGILSGNISAAAKQMGSGASAVATGRLDWKTGRMSLEIGKLAKVGSKARKVALAELTERVGSFRGRQVSLTRMLDVDDVVDTGSSHMIAGRDLSVKDIAQLAKDKDIKLSDAAVELLDKGMVMIKHLDEATMAAVWNAAKDKIANEVRKGNISKADAPNEEVQLFTMIMMESQPTSSPTTLSVNQQRGNFVARTLTQFSRQTRHNAILAFQASMEYINKEDKTTGDLVNAMEKLLPLAYQTVYVAAAGGLAAGTTTAMVSQLSSKKEQRKEAVRKRRDARTNNVAKEYFVKIIESGLGQMPVSAPILNAAFRGTMGEPVYSASVPIFQELIGFFSGFSDVQQGKVDQGLLKMQKEFFRLAGVPSIVNKAVNSSLK